MSDKPLILERAHFSHIQITAGRFVAILRDDRFMFDGEWAAFDEAALESRIADLSELGINPVASKLALEALRREKEKQGA